MTKIKLPPRTPAGMKTDGTPLEATIQEGIMRAWSRLPYVSYWRNNTGKLHDRNGRLVSYGLCPGSSDLIACVRRVVRPEDVGKTIGVFAAFEVKCPGEEPSEDQRIFLEVVGKAGGAEGWGSSVDASLSFLESARRGE